MLHLQPGLPPHLSELIIDHPPPWPFVPGLFVQFDDQFAQFFYQAFRLRFDGRRIGTQLPDLFANWCSGRFMERSSYYRQMLATLDIIENPFVNTYILETDKHNSAERHKDYRTAQGQHIANAEKNTGGMTATLTAATSGRAGGETSRTDTLSNERNVQRDTNDETVKQTDDYRFADTPQTQLSDTAAWDDNYLTTASNDQKNSVTAQTRIGANSRAAQGYNWLAREQTEASASTNAGQTRNVVNDASHDHAQDTHNALATGARVRETNDAHARQGLSGVLVSDAVVAWRKSLLPFLQIMVDDYTEFFLKVF